MGLCIGLMGRGQKQNKGGRGFGSNFPEILSWCWSKKKVAPCALKSRMKTFPFSFVILSKKLESLIFFHGHLFFARPRNHVETRMFSLAPALLAQAAFFTHNQHPTQASAALSPGGHARGRGPAAEALVSNATPSDTHTHTAIGFVRLVDEHLAVIATAATVTHL